MKTFLGIYQARADADAKEREVLELKSHVEAAEQTAQLAAAELNARLTAVTAEFNEVQVRSCQSWQNVTSWQKYCHLIQRRLLCYYFSLF